MTATVTGDLAFASETITISSCSDPRAAAANTKRALRKPACLSKYNSPNSISSACRCLSPTPSTTTVTSTEAEAVQTSTTIITVTTTNTYYEIAPEATQSFNILARAGDIDGNYLNGDVPYPYVQFSGPQSDATTFELTNREIHAAGGGETLGFTYVAGDPSSLRRVRFDRQPYLICRPAYDGVGCALNCQAGAFGENMHFLCNGGYWNMVSLYNTMCCCERAKRLCLIL